MAPDNVTFLTILLKAFKEFGSRAISLYHKEMIQSSPWENGKDECSKPSSFPLSPPALFHGVPSPLPLLSGSSQNSIPLIIRNFLIVNPNLSMTNL